MRYRPDRQFTARLVRRRACAYLFEVPDPSAFGIETLLDLLDELVRSDQGPAGFSGRVAVGIKEPSGASRWWLATFKTDGVVETAFFDEVPDFDVAVGVDGAADAVSVTTGNKTLLNRFLNRYLQDRSMLGIRSLQS